MPNMEFNTWNKFLGYIKEQEEDESVYGGPVLLHDFDILDEYNMLDKNKWKLADIIDYIIISNPTLWAHYWLRNPQNPSEPMRLFRYQKNIVNCQNKYKLTRCGRQIGKTVCMAIDMLWSSMCLEHSKILYVAPYQSQVKVCFEDTMMKLIFDVPEISNSIVKMPTHPYYQAIFKNGSEIKAMTAGTKSGQKGAGIRGISADRLYMDEVDFMGDSAIEAVSAVTAARPNARIWVSSTPSGKRENFYNWATERKSKFKCADCEKRHVDGTPFHYPSHVSPLFSADVDDFFKASYTESAYAHEILAEWGEELEGVFRHVDIDVCLSQGRHTIIPDNNVEDAYDVSYEYRELKPDRRNIYILGIDWNKEKTGVQLCIVEYNKSHEHINDVPPFMFRVFRTEIVTAKEFTERGTVSRVMQLDQEIPLSHIYADAGYGSIQVEAIKASALKMNKKELAEKILSVDLSSNQEVYDPLTRQKVKKPMKPFMVDVASRIVEDRRIILPDYEDEKIRLVGQMREYSVVRRGSTGHPVYSNDNEDMLTAWMFALLGFAKEYSELINIPSINQVSVSTNSINSRVAKAVPVRWAIGNKKSLSNYGVKESGPAFKELMQGLGIPYNYTRDSRDESLRPQQVNTQSGYSELRGSNIRNMSRSHRESPTAGRRSNFHSRTF